MGAPLTPPSVIFGSGTNRPTGVSLPQAIRIGSVNVTRLIGADGAGRAAYFVFVGIPDGGRSAAARPHAVFGFGPIDRMRMPPPVSSAWVNHERVSGLPFKLADWIYLFCAELFAAISVNFLPP